MEWELELTWSTTTSTASEVRVPAAQIPPHRATTAGKLAFTGQPEVQSAVLRVKDPVRPRPMIVVTGPLELSYEGVIHNGPLRQIATDVAAYLAWYPGKSTSAQAASRIWTNYRKGTQSAYFHNGKDYLRKALRSLCPDLLGPDGQPAKFLASDPHQTWSFLPDQCTLDIQLILQSLDAARTATADSTRLMFLQDAVTLWRGDYGVGCTGRWVSEIRASLRRQMLAAFCEIADLTMASEPDTALKALARARIVDASSEEVVRRSIQFLKHLGRMSEAREAWREFLECSAAANLVPSPGTLRVADSVLKDLNEPGLTP
jgi:DNA-binding SARP family transcriptional activator